jgi:hypothetical protein
LHAFPIHFLDSTSLTASNLTISIDFLDSTGFGGSGSGSGSFLLISSHSSSNPASLYTLAPY